jgi:hypothetical protein
MMAIPSNRAPVELRLEPTNPPAHNHGKPWPTATKIVAMIDARTVLACIAVVTPLAGCGSSANAPDSVPPPIAAKPDVLVTLDGEHHTCIVALSSEAQGSTIACDDVVPFVRDELRVPGGSIYEIRTIPKVEQAEMAKVEASLKGAGYHSSAAHAQR